jgi:hypothetical protein
VNSLFIEPDVLFNESFILPKSMHLCMIRFVDNTSIAQGGDASQRDEQDLMIKQGRRGRQAHPKITKTSSLHERVRDGALGQPLMRCIRV